MFVDLSSIFDEIFSKSSEYAGMFILSSMSKIFEMASLFFASNEFKQWKTYAFLNL